MNCIPEAHICHHGPAGRALIGLTCSYSAAQVTNRRSARAWRLGKDVAESRFYLSAYRRSRDDNRPSDGGMLDPQACSGKPDTKRRFFGICRIKRLANLVIKAIWTEGKGNNMLYLLVAIYAMSGLLHFLLVARHGVAGNVGTLVFGFIYAALAVAVYLNLPYALWIGLVLTLVGLTGLSLNFIGIAKTVTTGVVFWIVDAVVILLTLYLLFG